MFASEINLPGWGYKISSVDVFSAYHNALKAADVLGVKDTVRADIMKMVANDRSPGMFVRDILEKYL
jgi:hypothetical protein